MNEKFGTRIVLVIVLVFMFSPLILWGLDNIFHFGFASSN